MRLGVLGGTFDPVHYGHLRLAESAHETDRLELDKVIFIPAGQPWRKSGRAVTLPAHRAAMLELAIEGNDSFEMSTVELKREGPSYTVDTLEALQREYRGSEIFLILGEDALSDMANWREPERICSLARLAVAFRHERGNDEGEAKSLPRELVERVTRVQMEPLAISSSAIRERVRRGLSIRYLLPEAVRLYIEERGLYRE